MTLLNNIDIGNIVRECEHQDATYPVEIAGFAAAYAEVRSASKYSASPASARLRHDPIEWIRKLANLIEPKTQGKFRSGPVTFWNEEDPGTWEPINDSLASELIPRAMDGVVDAGLHKRITSDDFYQEFETIHPFADGNGRL